MITEIDKRTALILIDLQHGIVRNELAHPVSTVLGNVVLLAEAFRKAKQPIVVVNVNPTGAAWTKIRKEAVPAPANQPFEPAINPFEIVPEVNVQPTDIRITKKTWNAFFDTGLHEKLQELQVTGIVLAGISTSVGVEGTARAASELGYNISFATDAITDRSLMAHLHSTQNIFLRIGELGSTQEVINKLTY